MATGGCPIQETLSKECRVHFPDEQVQQHDSRIVIEQGSSDAELHVHLGFLQLMHRYEIKFNIQDSLGEKIDWDSSEKEFVTLTDAKPCCSAEGRQGHLVKLEFQSKKEKLVTEEILLSNSKKDKHLTLFLHARVLGKDKGTPVLREGIHCIEKYEPDDPNIQRSEFVRGDSLKAE